MQQGLPKIGEAEMVACGKQFGRLDAAACEEELLRHLTEHQACNKGWHYASWLLPQCRGRDRGKLSTAQGVGTDRVDRSRQRLDSQRKFNDGCQFVPPNPAHPLPAIACLKTYHLQHRSAYNSRDPQMNDTNTSFTRRDGGRFSLLIKPG